MWPDFMTWLKRWPLRENLISKKDLDNIFLAGGVEEAMGIIRKIRSRRRPDLEPARGVRRKDIWD